MEPGSFVEDAYLRGCIVKKHGSGAEVYMIKDEPGYYYNSFGHQVSEQMAKEAGFHVERFQKERAKKERLAQAYAEIENEIEASGGEEVVKEERGGYKIVDIGLGRCVLRGPDGTPVNEEPKPYEEMQVLLNHMVAPEQEATEQDQEPEQDSAAEDTGGGSGKRANQKGKAAMKD